MNVTESISKPFSIFGKSRKLDVRVVHREITTVGVAPSTSRQQMVAAMSKHFASILNSRFN